MLLISIKDSLLMRKVVLLLTTETQETMMDYPDGTQFSGSRTIWNDNLDTFDGNLIGSSLPSLEACSSTLLFQSTSSTCDESGDSPIFKSPYQQIFDDNPNSAVESRGVARSYCTDIPDPYMDPLEFPWSSALPHHDAGVSAPQLRLERPRDDRRIERNHHGSGLVPSVIGSFKSSTHAANSDSRQAQVNGHGPDYQVLLKPLMRQPNFRRPASGILPVTKFNAKASWQPAIQANRDLANKHYIPKKLCYKEPLGSPCSVISGFTKVLQGVDPLSSDYNMESSGPSTSAPLDESKSVSQETLAARKGATQSLSESLDPGGLNLGRPKRKRCKTLKQSDEVESQRMTHIAVERNRRKQMNEHLAALRALMPGSYVQKGDQASIVGGAIDFVKELEHLLNCLQAQKRRRAYSELTCTIPPSRPAMTSPDQLGNPLFPILPPFSVHAPQRAVKQNSLPLGSTTENLGTVRHPQTSGFSNHHLSVPSILLTPPASSLMELLSMNEIVGEAKSDMASVEVKMEGADQALVKIMAPPRTGQLLRTVVALESLSLTIMHTNITTVNQTVLYSFHVQIGVNCRMNVEEIAAALHQSFSIHSLQF